MTRSVLNNKKQHVGNGSATVFAYDFPMVKAAYAVVVLTDTNGIETTQVQGTHYTITVNADGGNVTFVSAPASGYKVTIKKVVPLTQEVDWQDGGAVSQETFEASLDKATDILVQLQEQIDRAPKFKDTSAFNKITFPELVANKALKVNAAGTGLEMSVNDFDTIVQDATNQANQANTHRIAAEAAQAAAEAAEGDATTQANNAAASALLASQWATLTSGAVAGGEWSAKFHAQQAAISATAAANAASSNMFSEVVDKSSAYAVVASDNGSLIRVDTTGGAVIITLPSIASVGDGFRVAVGKKTSDSNQVAIARAGSDTINGGTTYTIGSQFSIATIVADAETNEWFAIGAGATAGTLTADAFTGDGVTVGFTLSGAPGSKNNTYVYVSGVYQNKATYSLAGNVLTFSEAPPNGASIEVMYGSVLSLGVPADGTVSVAKLSMGVGTSAGNLVQLDGAGKLPAVDGSQLTNLPIPVVGAYKNLLIGGDFTTNPWQRGTTFTNLSNGSGGTYTADRWRFGANASAAVFTVQKTTDAPTIAQAGIYTQHCLEAVCTTADTSVDAGDLFILSQPIEGFNAAHMGFGAAGAKPITVSFWVKASVAGVYTGSVTNTIPATRAYPFEVTINQAATWEYKTITIAGDTSGTWAKDNTCGLCLTISLVCGSTFAAAANGWASGNYWGTTNQTNVAGAVGRYMRIALVQIEAGTQASAFETLPYEVVLRRCQRYFQRGVEAGTNAFSDPVSTNQVFFSYPLPVPLRASPTMIIRATATVNSPNSVSCNSTTAPSLSGGRLDCLAGWHSGFTGVPVNRTFHYATNVIDASAEL